MISIKLRRQLFDLFQHCELNCRADCCGWDAFDLSEHWLSRWCEFRDPDWISPAIAELAQIKMAIAECEADEKVQLERLFPPTVQSLAHHLQVIRSILTSKLPDKQRC